MARTVADVRYIASIYPGELDPIALNHGPSAKRGTSRRTVYRLKPVPREDARTKPCVIEVSDGYEDVLNVMGLQSGDKYTSKIVDVDETVRELLRYWTGNMVDVPPGAAPGIIQIANTFPTQVEFARLFEMQTAYFTHGYQEGERLNRENNWKEIKGAWKIGAIWLGVSPTPLWADPSAVKELVPCPECGGQIMPRVNVCIHCHTRLRPMSSQIALLNQSDAELDAATAPGR